MKLGPALDISCTMMNFVCRQQVMAEWNKTELDSFLIEISADILKFKDTDGSPLVEKIRDTAGQVGLSRCFLSHFHTVSLIPGEHIPGGALGVVLPHCNTFKLCLYWVSVARFQNTQGFYCLPYSGAGVAIPRGRSGV